MKNEATLINVSRGPIVDEAALLDALEDESIGAAGLDVCDPEPPNAGSPLRNHPKVMTTPHVARYSEEANAERRHEAATRVHAALTGNTPDNVVVGPGD